MIRWSRLLVAIVAVFAVCTGVHADMMQASAVDVDVRQVARAASVVDRQLIDSAGLCDYASITDLSIEPVDLSPQGGEEVGELLLTQNAQILTDGQSSLSLCLSALIGLGLCSSAHCLKKLSFGFIPEWYHNGGPYQIGHSFAVNPDSLCPAPAYCFIQPVPIAEDLMPKYRSGAVLSLWRMSQYTPDVIAPRGPPAMS